MIQLHLLGQRLLEVRRDDLFRPRHGEEHVSGESTEHRPKRLGHVQSESIEPL